MSICNFITHVHSVQKICSSTIQTYLAGINFFIKLVTGFHCPSISHSHITMLIKGLQSRNCSHNQTFATHFRPSQPLHPFSMLRLHIPHSWLNPRIHILAGFFGGFLRYSEFTPTSSGYNPSLHPSLSDITIHTPDSLIFTLLRRKTDQLRVSFPIYIFHLNSCLSPYKPLTKYISSRYAPKASSQHPLFLTETGKMATQLWFQKHLHKVLCISGISSKHNLSQSFHIGAASTVARHLSHGISDQTLATGHLRCIAPTSAIISMIFVKPTLISAQFNLTLSRACNQLGWKHLVLPDQHNRQHPTSTFHPSPHIHSSVLNIQYLLNFH